MSIICDLCGGEITLHDGVCVGRYGVNHIKCLKKAKEKQIMENKQTVSYFFNPDKSELIIRVKCDDIEESVFVRKYFEDNIKPQLLTERRNR